MESFYSMLGSDFSHYTGPSDTGYSFNGGATAPSMGGGFFSAGNMSSIAGGAGAVASMIGGISSAFAAYAQADSIKSNLQFQADMAKINARMAENTAQSIMDAGRSQNAASTMKYGQMAASQKASQGARGVAMGEGSAAEEIASTNIIKEIDSNTINANTVRAAWAARTQSVNANNQSLMAGVSASSINPMSYATNNMMNTATSVASNWYSSKRSATSGGSLADILANIGG